VIAYLGVGGNVGTDADILARFRAAAGELARVGKLTSSAVYRSAPAGPVADQPDYLNAVYRLEIAAKLEPFDLLGLVQSIECRLGRDRADELRFGPRSIDLDVLLIDELTTDDPTLTLPHPRMTERAFVLLPLCEVAPADLEIPGTGMPLGSLAAGVDARGVHRLGVNPLVP
jgi:2-amino-4-hydroxy-6-hydroxymethyldihydropteridine diphosphokinase